MSLPPPPPDYAPLKTRPSAVTKYATYMFIASIFCIIFGVIDFFVWGPPASYVLGVIFVILGVLFLIVTFALYAGQSWALTISGYSGSLWAQAPEVRAFFGLPPSNFQAIPATLTAAAPPPPQQLCSTCGQPLTFIPQYNRWYCQAEQKYV